MHYRADPSPALKLEMTLDHVRTGTAGNFK